MMKILLIIVAICMIAVPLMAQSEPEKEDSEAYSEAYTLLFDTEGRTRKAISLLLPEGTTLQDLTSRELSLLCRAYNELHDSKKQLEVARVLWDRDSTNPDATRWMTNSLLNEYGYADNSEPLMEFVEKALADGKGNRREFLLLKAAATIGQRKEIPAGVRRAAATELLIEAYASGESIQAMYAKKGAKFKDTPNFIDYTEPFESFFSPAERESLKVQMIRARKSEDEKRSKQ